MELHKTSQYAIRVLSYIANHDKEKTLYSSKELSKVLNISYKFLTRIMTDLAKAGFVNSIRGREGGFELGKKASEIYIIEVLNTFNDEIDHDNCVLGIGKCDNQKKCALHDQWLQPKELIQKMFANTTLENLQGSEFKL